MSSASHIPQEDLALYSMQALMPQEQAEVGTHLRGCAACRSVLCDIYQENALLALGVEQAELPPGMQQRFLATVANTPQEVAGAESAARQPVAAPVEEPVLAGRRGGTGLGWLGWLTAFAAIAIAVYFGYNNERLGQQLNKDRTDIAQLSAQAARAEILTDALTSPAAKQVTLTETKEPAKPVGHATYLPSKGALVFVASNLHPVKADKTYELWLIPADGKAPIPAGLFRPDAAGSASVVLPRLPEGLAAKAFGVTIEDAQGSATPTLPIVLSGS